MAKDKNISIRNIELNTENPRFEIVSSTKEAIDIIVDDQNTALYNLASHIIKHGLNPTDKILVIPSKDNANKYIVVEGNRRICSLKILNNPDLIDASEHSNLKKRFKKLKNDNISKIPKSIPCIVLDNIEEADLWIGVKHAGKQNGVGTVTWDPTQKNRYEQRTTGKSSLSLQFITLLKESEETPETVKNDIDKIKSTNVERLLSDPYIREKLGLELSNKLLISRVDKKEVIKGLSNIASDLLKPTFTVKNIYNSSLRKKYIDGVGDEKLPNLSKYSTKPWQLNESTQEPTTSTNASKGPKITKAVKKERTTLIPTKSSIVIEHSRINDIYVELKSLHIEKHKNAIGVLFRVFVELSLDCYIENKKLTNAVSAQKSGKNLQQKAFIVIDHLTNNNQIDQAISKGIRGALKDTNNILSTDTLHAYVHNHRITPIPDHMIITWDSMEEFMSTLWLNI